MPDNFLNSLNFWAYLGVNLVLAGCSLWALIRYGKPAFGCWFCGATLNLLSTLLLHQFLMNSLAGVSETAFHIHGVIQSLLGVAATFLAVAGTVIFIRDYIKSAEKLNVPSLPRP